MRPDQDLVLRQVKFDPAQTLLDALYNQVLLTNARAIAATRSVRTASITPGTPERLHRNELNTPYVVYVRLQPDTANLVNQALYLSLESGKATATAAQVAVAGLAPETSFLLQQGQECWADVLITYSGDATLVYSVIPLKGMSVVFGQG